MSKDDKTPPENSAESKDPKDSKVTGNGASEDKKKEPSGSASKSTSMSGGKSVEKDGNSEADSAAKSVSEEQGEDADGVVAGAKGSSRSKDKAEKDPKAEPKKETSEDEKSFKFSKSSKDKKKSGDDGDVDAAGAEEKDGAKTAGGKGSTKRGGVPPWVAVLSVVILVVGLAGAVWQAIGYFQDRSDKNAAALRDEVIDVASQVVVNSLSFSADTIDEDQERLREGSTGEFLAQQDEYAEQIKQTVMDQGATTSAQISNSALSDINEDAGTATVLLVYTAQSEREELPPVSGRQAARVELIREGDQWKVAELVAIGSQVPVGESSEGVQELDDVTGGAGVDTSEKPDSDADGGAGAGGGDSDSDASPTSGAAATTAGGN